jgi:phosphate transport system substrate-binding protein
MKRILFNPKTILSLAAITGIVITLSSFKKVENKPTPDDLKGTINISGAFALYPITVKWAQEFKKIHPNVVFNISAGGAGKGK